MTVVTEEPLRKPVVGYFDPSLRFRAIHSITIRLAKSAMFVSSAAASFLNSLWSSGGKARRTTRSSSVAGILGASAFFFAMSQPPGVTESTGSYQHRDIPTT
jgi:hypothetical protein